MNKLLGYLFSGTKGNDYGILDKTERLTQDQRELTWLNHKRWDQGRLSVVVGVVCRARARPVRVGGAGPGFCRRIGAGSRSAPSPATLTASVPAPVTAPVSAAVPSTPTTTAATAPTPSPAVSLPLCDGVFAPHLVRGLPVAFGKLDLEGVAQQPLPITRLLSILGVARVFVLNIGKAPGPFAVVVQGNVDVGELTILGEHVSEILG